MNQVACEFLPSLVLDERRRQARRDALLAAASLRPGPWARAAARFGGALIAFGRRLERRGAHRPPPLHAVLEACDCVG